MKPLNILIVCEHASDQFGGEAMLPLKYFHYLCQQQQNVYLLTHTRVKDSAGAMKNVFYIPDTRRQILLHRLGEHLPDRIDTLTTNALSHMVTQVRQWIYTRRIVKSKHIDIIHEVAPVSPKQASVMFGFGVPVVIGPMNGGMRFPKPFKHMSGYLESAIQVAVRLCSHALNILIPGKLLASRLIVANPRTRAALPWFHFGRVVQIVENAVDQVSEGIQINNIPKQSGIKTRVLYVGRLVDWKVVDILIDVFAKLGNTIHLDIVGGGTEMEKLQKQASDLSNITFHGWVEHTAMNQVYAQADIFVLPSVRECGGAVVLEAMASGLPVIATDWGGPADYIAEGTGYLIKPISREYMVDEFKKHIEMLAHDPETRHSVGAKAKAHIAENFLWENKVKQMIQLYHEVIAE